MAVKLSTGLVNYLSGGGSLRKAFQDCELEIWSGAPPATADIANSGTLLCTVTKSSGTTTLRPGWGEVNIVTVTSHAPGETFAFDVTIGSETLVSTNIYTNTPDAGTVNEVALILARLFEQVGCSACATGTSGAIYVMAPSGKSLLIALHAGMTGTIAAVSDAVIAADAGSECLHFGPPTAGIISKDSATWSGLNAATGVAGYFRFIQPGDVGHGDAAAHGLSTTALRIQGAVSTSGAEMNLSNTTLTASATTTIDAGSFTEPMTA